MKAIVCDLCGNVELLSDRPYDTVFCSRLVIDEGETITKMEICQECTKRLVDQVKKIRNGDVE